MTRRSTIRSRRGFTIVELIISIGIVVILVGLTVTVGAAVIRQSEVHRTENALRLLDLTMQEWEASADRSLSWGGPTADLPASTPYEMTLTVMLERVLRNESAAAIFAQIDDSLVHVFQPGEIPLWVQHAYMPLDFGRLAVLDAWGTPIYGLHPGAAVPGAIVDPDGTERTPNEWYYGVAANRKICFISAGPDGSFGDMRALEGTLIKEQTRDNVYSYPVGDPW